MNTIGSQIHSALMVAGKELDNACFREKHGIHRPLYDLCRKKVGSQAAVALTFLITDLALINLGMGLRFVLKNVLNCNLKPFSLPSTIAVNSLFLTQAALIIYVRNNQSKTNKTQ